MDATERIKLLADLKRDEGFRGFLYDDATGQRIGRGDTLEGCPTIGYGWNLAAQPIPEPVASRMLASQMDETVKALRAALPWADALPAGAWRGLANMAFNLGINGLLEFTEFLALLETAEYARAASDLMGTLYARQVGARAVRIARLIGGSAA